EMLETTRRSRSFRECRGEQVAVEREQVAERDRGGDIASVVPPRQPCLQLHVTARGAQLDLGSVQIPARAPNTIVGLRPWPHTHDAPTQRLDFSCERVAELVR